MDQLTDIFIAASFFLSPLRLMGSLQNIDTELFSFIAATKVTLIRSERMRAVVSPLRFFKKIP